MVVLARVVLALDQQGWVLIVLVNTEHLRRGLLQVRRVDLVVRTALEQTLVKMPDGRVFTLFFLDLLALVNFSHHILNDKWCERIHLSEHCGNEAATDISCLVAGLGLIEVSDHLEVDLVPLLGNNTEVFEKLIQIGFGCTLLSLQHLLLLLFLVRSQLGLELFIEQLHGLGCIFRFLFECFILAIR